MKKFIEWIKDNIECIIIMTVIAIIVTTVIVLFLTGVISETNTVESNDEYISMKLLHHVTHLH